MSRAIMSNQWPHTMPALITPFTSNGLVDIAKHRHNVSVAISQSSQGVLVAGSTGEGPYIEQGERTTLVSEARSVSTDLVIICAIFAETDRQAHAQITEAADAGANAVLVVTPTTLIRGRDIAVADFFLRVADFSPVPILLYTVPPVTGYELPVPTIAELANHDVIRGMKDSGGDPSRVGALKTTLSRGFLVYAGNSSAVLESAQLGAHGAITASANYAATTLDRAVAGDATAQDRLNTITAIVQHHGVAGTKFAASLQGMEIGTSRLPLQAISPEAEQSIRAAFTDLTSASPQSD